MGVRQSVIVIGGGLTGLACAYRLKQSGIPVLLLEAADFAGGMMATTEKNGFLFEAGPQCPRFPLPLWELVRDLKLEDEFVPGDSRLPRYIVKNGRLHSAPFSPSGFIFTRLVGAASKYRILAEIFRRSQPPSGEESLAGFVRRKFDDDVLAYLGDPFISAIFAGDVEKMGVESAFPALARWEREHGSVLRGAIQSRKRGSPSATRKKPLVVTESLPAMGSFRAGLGTLPKKIAQTLGDSIRLRAKVESIEADKTHEEQDSIWRVRLSGGEELGGAVVVVAAPAYEATRLLRSAAPELSAALSTISYAPMAVVSSGYDRAQVRNPLHGFGLMIPRREKLNTIFNVWNSSVFEGRAPKGNILMTSFAGGATNPAFLDRDEAAIAQIVGMEMGNLLGIDGPPVEQFVWKHVKALPQFNIGHGQTLETIRGALQGFPGLHLAGNYFEGRSLGDCVEAGSRTAEKIGDQFSRRDI
jgi:oxygen-dependent protoporphyrinogen oxidase